MGKYPTVRLRMGSVADQYEWETPMCEAPQAICSIIVRGKSLRSSVGEVGYRWSLCTFVLETELISLCITKALAVA